MTQVLRWFDRCIGCTAHNLDGELLAFDLLLQEALLQLATEVTDELFSLFLCSEADAPIDLCRDRLANHLLAYFLSVDTACVLVQLLASLGAEDLNESLLCQFTDVLDEFDANIFELAANRPCNTWEILHLKLTNEVQHLFGLDLVLTCWLRLAQSYFRKQDVAANANRHLTVSPNLDLLSQRLRNSISFGLLAVHGTLVHLAAITPTKCNADVRHINQCLIDANALYQSTSCKDGIVECAAGDLVRRKVVR